MALCANPRCKRQFEPRRKNQRFCQTQCRQQAKNERWPLVRVNRRQAGLLKARRERQEAKTSGVPPLPGPLD